MSDDRLHDSKGGMPEERIPINNVGGGGCAAEDHVNVVVRPHPRGKGCYLSRAQVCLTFIVVLVLLATVGIVVAILMRDILGHGSCPGGAENGGEASAVASGSTTRNFTRVTTPKPTVEPSLPWSEIRLPRDAIPTHYNLEIRVDLDTFTFTGSSDVTLDITSATRYVIVHVNGLDIHQHAVSVRHVASNQSVAISRQLHVPENQFYVLETHSMLITENQYRVSFGHFRGNIHDDLRGLYRSMYKDQNGNTKYLATSQLQSIDARRVFPCMDEPDLKAEFSVSIIHRPEFVALSNMPSIRKVTLEDNWIQDVYEKTPKMSTYLLAFVIADFMKREQVANNGLKIRIWAQPDMYEQTAYALDFTAKAYMFFGEYFGTPEVVPKADHVAIPDFSAGAMENWGLVLYRETALLHDEKVSSIANKYWVSLVMAHEVAHTWFGNMATMRWWDDLWLNEGFANTLMYFALDSIYKTWNVFDLQLVNNVYPVMTKDSLLTSHAISAPILDPDDIPQLFDSISYDKGMAVLRLLRGFLGWDDFQKGLQMYVQRYKFTNAEMPELWDTFAEAVDGRYNVAEIMDTWTRQMGFPFVTVRHKGGDVYALEQDRFLLNPEDKYDPTDSKFGYKWIIPFIYQIQKETEARTQWMDMGSAEVVVPQGAWLIGNLDYMGFYRTNYDDVMWRRLIEQLNKDHTVFSAANRAGLISDAFNLARANKLSYEIAFNLTSYLHKETEYVPWRAFLDSINFVKGMLATSNSFGFLQKYIFNLVAQQHRRVGTSDQGDLLERNLRKLMLEAASGVGVPDAVDWAKNMYNNWMQYESTWIPPDYAVVIYAVGIQQGGEYEWDYLWNKAQKTRVASESEIMMTALAYSQEPWLLWRYARWSLDSSKIRMQDVRNLFRYFSNTPLGRYVALQFMLTKWDEINEKFGMDAFLLRDIIYATTSLINTDYELEQLTRLYQESPPPGVASKAADNSLALIRSNINWMKLNHDTIHTWLKANVKDTMEETARLKRRT